MRVVVYSKADCSLCDEALKTLEELQAELPHQLVEVDVESEPSLAQRYAAIVPVVEVGPYKLAAPFTATDLRVTLGAARDGGHVSQPSGRLSHTAAVRLNKGLRFFASRWLAILNLAVLLYVGVPFAAPALMKLGAIRQAGWIYTAYSPLCHQLAFRSWFLFGEQATYPRELAGLPNTTFGEATGLDESDLLAARRFVGNEELGYKVAFCERDIAIYASVFVAGVLFALVRHRLRPLPVYAWLLLGVLPIALDGGTQLLSGLPIPFLSFAPRESTPFLRTLTGALFGVMNVWLAYPYLQRSMAETKGLITAKLKAAEGRKKRPLELRT